MIRHRNFFALVLMNTEQERKKSDLFHKWILDVFL
jgi:hypothetical protein